MKRIYKILLLSVLLSFLLMELVGWIVELNDNSTVGTLKDYFALPGAMIAAVLYPEGVHTGSGVPYWGYAVRLGNLLFYTGLWFLLLQSIGMMRKIHLKRRLTSGSRQRSEARRVFNKLTD